LGEPFSPPRVVFRDRVKLRQVKRNRPDSHPPLADSRLTNTLMTAFPLSPVNPNCTSSAGMVGNIFRNVGEIPHPSAFNQNQKPSPMPRNKSCGSWARFDPLVKSLSLER